MFPNIKDKKLREYIDHHEKYANLYNDGKWSNPIDIKMLTALDNTLRENKKLRKKITELKDSLRAALMQPQWKRKQK